MSLWTPEQFLSESWTHSFWILFFTLILSTLVRAFLGWLRRKRDSRLLQDLTPYLAIALLLIGVKASIDSAPISGRVEMWANSICYIISVVVFLRFVQNAALITLDWSISHAHHSRQLELGFLPLMRNILTLFILMSGSIMILKHFNYDVLSLLTALGVGSLAVGLAAKDTLSHMIAGFVLIIDRNLRPGDRVNLGGTIGDVKEMGLRSTQIKTKDGNTLIVPNSDLVNTKILNFSLYSRETLCSSQIRAPYAASFSKIKTIALSILEKMEHVSKSRPRSITIHSLAEGFQMIQVTFWVIDYEHAGLATSTFNEQLLVALQEAGITLQSA